MHNQTAAIRALAVEAGLEEPLLATFLARAEVTQDARFAALRTIADVLHDARPIGNPRPWETVKRLSAASAVARRLAEAFA